MYPRVCMCVVPQMTPLWCSRPQQQKPPSWPLTPTKVTEPTLTDHTHKYALLYFYLSEDFHRNCFTQPLTLIIWTPNTNLITKSEPPNRLLKSSGLAKMSSLPNDVLTLQGSCYSVCSKVQKHTHSHFLSDVMCCVNLKQERTHTHQQAAAWWRGAKRNSE